MKNEINYTELLKSNREDIIEICEDVVNFTNVSVKTLMTFIMQNEAKFAEVVEKEVSDGFSTAEYKAFKKLANIGMTSNLDLRVSENDEKVEARRIENAKVSMGLADFKF